MVNGDEDALTSPRSIMLRSPDLLRRIVDYSTSHGMIAPTQEGGKPMDKRVGILVTLSSVFGIFFVVLTIGFVQVLSAMFGWGPPLTLGVTLLALSALMVEFVVVFIRSRNNRNKMRR